MLFKIFQFFDQRTVISPGPAGIFQLAHHALVNFRVKGLSDSGTPGALKGGRCHGRHQRLNMRAGLFSINQSSDF